MKYDKKSKAEISKFNPVPRHRSYGVTRKEYAWIEHIKLWIFRIVATAILSIPIIAIVIGIIAVMLYSSILAKVLLWTAILSFIISIVTKKARIRLNFNKKLKKYCKIKHFDLRYERKFRESLKWGPDSHDLTIETPTRIYYLHVLYVGKARQQLLFESEKSIKLITPPPKSSFAQIFELKPRIKELTLDISSDKSIGQKEAMPVVLVLPGCLDMSYKHSAASTVPTGNGGEHFGYTVFTVKGFMNFLPRYEDNAIRNNKI